MYNVFFDSSGSTKSVLTGSIDHVWVPLGVGQRVTLLVEPNPGSVPCTQPKLRYLTETLGVRTAAAQLAGKVKQNKGKLARMKSLSVKVGYGDTNPQEGSRWASAVFLFCVQQPSSCDFNNILTKIKSNTLR